MPVEGFGEMPPIATPPVHTLGSARCAALVRKCLLRISEVIRSGSDLRKSRRQAKYSSRDRQIPEAWAGPEPTLSPGNAASRRPLQHVDMVANDKGAGRPGRTYGWLRNPIRRLLMTAVGHLKRHSPAGIIAPLWHREVLTSRLS